MRARRRQPRPRAQEAARSCSGPWSRWAAPRTCSSATPPPLPRRRLPIRVRHRRVRRLVGAGRQDRAGSGSSPSSPHGRRAARRGGPGHAIHLLKNNVDSAGNAFGSTELPGGPARGVHPPAALPAALPGHPPDHHRRRGSGAPPGRGRRRRRAGPVRLLPPQRPHVGGGLLGHHPHPPDHQHPGRAARRSQPLPAPARHRGRLHHERGLHPPPVRDHRPGAARDRGRARPNWAWPTTSPRSAPWLRTSPAPRCRRRATTTLEVQQRWLDHVATSPRGRRPSARELAEGPGRGAHGDRPGRRRASTGRSRSGCSPR